jgi:hypothetical protein
LVGATFEAAERALSIIKASWAGVGSKLGGIILAAAGGRSHEALMAMTAAALGVSPAALSSGPGWVSARV